MARHGGVQRREAILLEQIMEGGDVTESDEPFGMLPELGKIQFAYQMHGSVTAPTTEYDFGFFIVHGFLQEAMDDEEAKVIFCSRGGYGAVHLIGKLDFTKFRQHPKWLIGFSDITALHNLFQQNGFASLHAPMARHLTVEPEDDFCTQALKDILFGQALGGTEAFSYVCPGHKLNHKGEGKGVLRGGNLSVFYGLRGTPYDIPAEGTILFIEDVGERPHAVERMMYNLKLGGVLDKLSGLIIGQFTEYEENKSLGKDLYGALADLVKEYDYPICFDFPVGHVSMNVPLINGAAVTLKVGKKEVKLSFNTERE